MLVSAAAAALAQTLHSIQTRSHAVAVACAKVPLAGARVQAAPCGTGATQTSVAEKEEEEDHSPVYRFGAVAADRSRIVASNSCCVCLPAVVEGDGDRTLVMSCMVRQLRKAWPEVAQNAVRRYTMSAGQSVR